jgi:predicted transcriptional regulator
MTKKEHRKRILAGLIHHLQIDLHGNGAAYIYEDANGEQLSLKELEKAKEVGLELIKKLRAMAER